jgi:hypothetical protein
MEFEFYSSVVQLGVTILSDFDYDDGWECTQSKGEKISSRTAVSLQSE